VIKFLTNQLARALASELGGRLSLRVQLPLTLSSSEPEPDLAVALTAHERHVDRHPHTALLVIEVAGRSQAMDLGAKAALYAAAGVKEYWVVDLAAEEVVVHRGPKPGERRFRQVTAAARGEVLVSRALTSVRIKLDDLFGR